MRINRHDRDVLINLIQSSEDRLTERILHYADQQGYTSNTSTLKEAWRLSIRGFSKALIEIVIRSDLVLELGQEAVFTNDPAVQLGIKEACRHHARGGNLSMFLGLMKFYRQSYIDLLRESGGFDHPEAVELLVSQFYDCTVLVYCNEWVGFDSDPEAQINELSSSSRRLANERNKYLVFFDSLSSPVILCDVNGSVENFNKAAGRLLLGRDAFGSGYHAGYNNGMVRLGLLQELARLKQTGSDCLRVEKRYMTSEGEKTYDILIDRMLDVRHGFFGFTLLFHDISDRLQWAEALQTANDKQQRLIENLHRTRQHQAQSEKMAAIGQLASGMSHEINTPIQYIGDNIRFMEGAFDDLIKTLKVHRQLLAANEGGDLTRGLEAQTRSQLEEVELDYLVAEIPLALKQSLEGIKKVSGIVSAMTDFVRPGIDEKVDTDINTAVRSILEVSANEWKYHADIETELDMELPLVPVVPGEINQALLNIIVNAAYAVTACAAREATAGKGKIGIRTRRDDNWVVIEISDTGHGIPEEIQSKIFDPFFTTREVGEGVGQGLTVAYQTIVKKHGGRIDVQSAPKKGTTFQVRLPIQPATNEDAERKLWHLPRLV